MNTVFTTRIAAAGLLGVSPFETGLAAEEKFRRLSGAQIQPAFAGIELTDEVHWREVDRNGTLTTYELGRKRVGKWRVQASQLCIEVGEGGDSGCFESGSPGRKSSLDATHPTRHPLKVYWKGLAGR